ncbi:hypothetical protein [Jannaschia sp. CCS1]|uniref:hypothetical protein n=1 Tax=Jannaschia sp. (strain CCS1) TaxID=290400 RepID=UPI000053DA52|nr:hypothetical protein [Jannaschia sp. CCS1]ABD55753.1 hypothetical protein Jann_2836 [Jannaschia sp. CCS1]
MGRKQEDLSDASTLAMQRRTPQRPQADRRDEMDGTAADPLSELTFEQALRDALASGQIAEARTLIATAEAALHAPGMPGQGYGDMVGPTDLAAAKARTAMATGDRAAARAILIRAIEADPKAAPLKALMTEVMMADGRATDVRPVLQHLGNDPTDITTTPGTSDEGPGPILRDTSG